MQNKTTRILVTILEWYGLAYTSSWITRLELGSCTFLQEGCLGLAGL